MSIDWKKEIKLSDLWKRSGSKAEEPETPKASPVSATKTPRLSAPKLPRRRRSSNPRRPTLGGPQLHPPKFVADLYADLRDRHLLPLVALLIIAMVAAPFLLSGNDHEEEQATITPPKAAGAEAADAGFTVVPAEPGLHDYKRRLGHRQALDPFRQAPGTKQGTKASQGSSSSPSASSTTTTGMTEPTGGESTSYSASTPVTTQETKTVKVGNVTKEIPITTAEKEAGESKPTEKSQVESTHTETAPVETTQTESTTVESSGGETGTIESHETTSTTGTGTTSTEAVETTEATRPPRTKPATGTSADAATAKPSAPAVTHEVVGYTIDAETGFVPHSTEKTELPAMTKLPNPRHPVVLYMGLSRDHKRALFLMTSSVTAYYGGHCALDKQACQLVEVKPGKGVTFAYGYGKSRFKVHLKKIVPTRRFSK
jgi:hypothetical protein